MRVHHAVLLLGLYGLAGQITAQYNRKGMLHLAIGGSFGAHATELEQSAFGFSTTETDGAATSSIPIQIGYAITDRFSLGLLVEPGRYLPDSADGDQNNSCAVVALEPRFYILNGSRFALHAALQLGGAALRIQDDTPGETLDARLSGGAFGVGAGVAIGLGNTIGLGFDLRYLATNLEVRALELNDVNIMDYYSGTLRTSGLIVQLSLAFRLGGVDSAPPGGSSGSGG